MQTSRRRKIREVLDAVYRRHICADCNWRFMSVQVAITEHLAEYLESYALDIDEENDDLQASV